MNQVEYQMKALRDKLVEAERINKEEFDQNRVKEETYKNTIIELKTEVQAHPSPEFIE
jgi:hypothetical protein